MATAIDKTKPGSQKSDQVEELKTEGPLSEKDEVKAAESKMAKQRKKAAQTSKEKK